MISKCSSQEECFQNVEKAFFGFDYSSLPFETQDSLTRYKNHVALSWLYYTQAKQKVDEINRTCLSNDQTFLPKQVNELNHYIIKAFDEMDSANKQAFAILALEEALLREEEVELVNEEDAYDVLIELNAQLGKLYDSSLNVPGLVDQYFKVSEEFQEHAQSIGLNDSFMREYYLLETVQKYDKPFLSLVKGHPLFLTITKDAAQAFIERLLSMDKLTAIMQALPSIQPFKTLSIYNAYAGTKESITREFSELMQFDAQARAELSKSIQAFTRESKRQLELAERQAQSLQASTPLTREAEANLLQEATLPVASPDTISEEPGSLDTQSLPEFQEKTLARLQSLKAELSAVETASLHFTLSKGMILSKLKTILKEATLIQHDTSLVSQEAFQQVTALCNAKASKSQELLNQRNNEPSESLTLLQLQNKVAQDLQAYQGLEEESKLLACSRLSKDLQELQSATANMRVFNGSIGEQTNQCMQSVTALARSELADASIFKPQTLALESLREGLEPLEFLSECQRIEAKATQFIMESERVQAILQSFTALQHAVAILQSLSRESSAPAFPEGLSMQEEFASRLQPSRLTRLTLNEAEEMHRELQNVLQEADTRLQEQARQLVRKPSITFQKDSRVRAN